MTNSEEMERLYIRQDIAQGVRGSRARSDQITSIRLLRKPNTTIIQVCAPTIGAEEDEIERFYTSIQEEIDHTPKEDMLITIGDWNTEVGNRAKSNITGKFELGVRNEAGDWLMNFCKASNLSIAETCFKQLNRQLYTRTSADGRHRNQIDHVTRSRRWRSCVPSARTRPGADCGTDHELLITIVKVKLRKSTRTIVLKYNVNTFPTNLKFT